MHKTIFIKPMSFIKQGIDSPVWLSATLEHLCLVLQHMLQSLPPNLYFEDLPKTVYANKNLNRCIFFVNAWMVFWQITTKII